MWRQRRLLDRLLLFASPHNNNKAPLSNVTTFDPTKCDLQAVPLKSRSLLRLSGPDTRTFLQGLITNDINHLKVRPSLFTLLLNHQGRVLYDAFVYNDTVLSSSDDKGNGDSVILECDAELQQKVVKHLQLFRVKKAVDISVVREEEGSLWVVFDTGHKYVAYASESPIEYPLIDSCCAPTPPNYSSKREELPFLKEKEAGVLCQQFGDPRLPQLGWRVLVKGSVEESRKLFPKEVKVVSADEQEYTELRYSLGVGEGAAELPVGGCFPLESNGDYLHGISFQKGCYIGQELTARTHHTGIIRKRLMPFRLPDDVSMNGVDLDSLQIVSEKNRPVGKVRGLSRTFGIALVRVEDALNAKQLILNDHTVSLSKPVWWPIQAAKEVSSVTKK